MSPLDRLAGLLDAVEGAEQILVLTHDNPDPDALASAAGLTVLLEGAAGAKTQAAFGGIVGRAENRVLIQEMGRDFERIEDLVLPAGAVFAMVDTQPRAGNNSLPEGRIVSAVIDHHPVRADTAVQFTDVRPEYGACASMVLEYLRATDIEIEPWLATALFVAIQAETLDLSREAAPEDVEASTYLYGRTQPASISRIRRARVPASYFRSLQEGLAVARCYPRVVTVPLGVLPYPDLVAEIADLLLQMQGVDWTIATGRYRDRLLVSVRARPADAHAGALVREAVGDRGSAGGHGTFGGGQIALGTRTPEEVADLREEILDAMLVALDVDPDEVEPLVRESVDAPTDAYRVGLRPWRSRMDVTNFSIQSTGPTDVASWGIY